MSVQPIPSGFHTITPYLMAKEASKLIDFLRASNYYSLEKVRKVFFRMVMFAWQGYFSLLVPSDSHNGLYFHHSC